MPVHEQTTLENVINADPIVQNFRFRFFLMSKLCIYVCITECLNNYEKNILGMFLTTFFISVYHKKTQST